MTANGKAPDACRHGANLKTTYDSNNNQDQSDSQADSMPLLCSGYGQFHTDEPGKETRKPYAQINLEGIHQLVDTPQQVDKSQAQWLIPSTLPCRTFKKQEESGKFWMLWVDIDQNPKGIIEVVGIVGFLIPGCNYEVYTSKSATKDNQKCRVLVPLSKPLSGVNWGVCQAILNDNFETNEIIPDRASERAAQLCYLPNRGEFYDSKSKRDGKYFDPMLEWADEIKTKQEEIEQQANELERHSNEVKASREAFKSYSGTSAFPSLIDAFYQTYTVQDILLQAGYDQRGNTFRHPHSESGSFSASVRDSRVHTLSSNDPLYTNGSGAHDAFSAFKVLFHRGDEKTALKDAGDNWVMIGSETWNTVKQQEYAQQNGSKSFENDVHFEDEQPADEQANFEHKAIPCPEYPPGLTGVLAEYIFSSSRMPSKPFAVAAALIIVSHLNCNYSYVVKSNTALNLYVCLIGDTGKGKEDPRKAIKRLIDTASNNWSGEDSKIHESVASGAALLRSFEDYPNALILFDEFGIYLQNTLSDKGSIHQKELIRELMIIFGLGRSYFAGKTYADKKQNIGRINKPYVNLLGTTTPLELLDGITPKTIDNGFLNRILFIQTDKEHPTNREPDIQVSDDLKQSLLRLKGLNGFVRTKEIVYEEGAHELLIQHVEGIPSKGQFVNLWGRAEEQTIRVAGLLAIGDGYVIKREHINWAWNYVNSSIKAFEQKLDKDLAENPFQKYCAKSLDLIRNVKNYSSDKQFGKFCKRGHMPKGKLTKLLKIKSKEVDEVITYLIETRQISHCDAEGNKCYSVL